MQKTHLFSLIFVFWSNKFHTHSGFKPLFLTLTFWTQKHPAKLQKLLTQLHCNGTVSAGFVLHKAKQTWTFLVFCSSVPPSRGCEHWLWRTTFTGRGIMDLFEEIQISSEYKLLFPYRVWYCHWYCTILEGLGESKCREKEKVAQKSKEKSNNSCWKLIEIQTDQNMILWVWSFKNNAGRKDEKIDVISISTRDKTLIHAGMAAYLFSNPVWLWRIFADSFSRPNQKRIIIQVTTPLHFHSVSKVFSSSESRLTWLIKRDMKALLLFEPESLAAATSGTRCHCKQYTV